MKKAKPTVASPARRAATSPRLPAHAGRTILARMTVELIPLVSPLHPGFDLRTVHRELFAALSAEHEVHTSPPGSSPDLRLVFVASGGTERQFAERFDSIPRPVYLLTDGKHNSLAASLEISAWVRAQGERCEILHGEPSEVARRVNDLAAAERAMAVLADSRFGVVGEPSDWLIASSIDRGEAKRRFGIATEDVALEELYRFVDEVGDGEAMRTAKEIRRRSTADAGVGDESLVQATRIYLGMKRLVRDRELTAITVRCFDLVTRYRNTGCLAPALLNDEGVMAGCEGDQQALFTVVAANALTGEIPFLANPAALDIEHNAIELAHCMIATSIVDRFSLRTHFETGLGVAIEGEYSTEHATIVRFGGERLSYGWVSHAEREDAPYSEERCRTQVRLRLHEDARYFLERAVANHHIVVAGRWADRTRAFMERAGIADVGSASR